jgi:hypothetical protein
MKQILKCLVGSQAHGLATPESDFDYRGIFVESTSEILKIGGSTKTTNWTEDKDDDTSWEIGHFLFLATKCNPTILEVFAAPVIESTKEGDVLRNLFSAVWNKTGVYNAFRGYGLNQRKKFLDDKDSRARKYACAYLRSLYQGCVLLETGQLPVNMTDTPVFDMLKKWKSGEFSVGEVMQICWEYEQKITEIYNRTPVKETDMDNINEFLLTIRRDNF